jgi:hypothetical protein
MRPSVRAENKEGVDVRRGCCNSEVEAVEVITPAAGTKNFSRKKMLRECLAKKSHCGRLLSIYQTCF